MIEVDYYSAEEDVDDGGSYLTDSIQTAVLKKVKYTSDSLSQARA